MSCPRFVPKIALLGSRGAGKRTLLRRFGWLAPSSGEHAGPAGLETSLTLGARALRAYVLDTDADLPAGRRAAFELEPENFADRYRASYGARVMILALGPEDLGAASPRRRFHLLANHVERALLGDEPTRVAIAYTRCDEYAPVEPARARWIESESSRRAWRSLVQAPAEGCAEFLEAIAPRGDARRAALIRSLDLWREVAACARGADDLLNGYFLAAEPAPAARATGWRPIGLEELRRDLLEALER